MQEFMKSSLDYIEQNLKTDITAEELAGMAGYSIWHYYRLFSKVTGSSVLGYILKRRLDHALAEISEGRKAIDVVFEYGFDTYAGFYKAFVKMYGISPKKYLSIYSEYKSKKSGGFYMMNRKEFTEGEIRRVLTNWNIVQDLPLTSRKNVRMMDGNVVSPYEWKVGEDYILITDNERGSVMKNMRVHKALAAHGFAGALPVKTNSDAEYLDGAYVFTLMPVASGEPLIQQIEQFDGKYHEFGFRYGKAIAKLHNVLSTVESDIIPYDGNLYEYADSYISQVLGEYEKINMDLPKELLSDYRETFNGLFDKLPKQLILGNAHPRNILFVDGEVSGFEFNGVGHEHIRERTTRLYDLCYCADDILGELSGWWNRTSLYEGDDIHDKWLEILSGILHGYDSINKLTAEEKQAVYYVMCSLKIVYNGMLGVASPLGNGEYKGWNKTTGDNFRYIVENKERIFNIF